MGWDEVWAKHRENAQSEFISCDDPHEKARLRDIIIEEFPSLSVPAIDEAINYCCAATRAPRLRKEFINCLSRQLGNENLDR